MRRIVSPDGHRRQRGLTLVELLVSMLIMGFVLTLVSQAVYQVAQVARSAQQVSARLATHWAGGRAAEPVIANLVAPTDAPVGQAFVGGPTELTGYSVQPPFGSGTGVRRFRLALRPVRDDSARSEMVADEGDDLARVTEPAVIARFDARTEFAYAASDGQISPVWPANTVSGRREPAELPRAVLLRERGTGRVLMWYGFQGEPSRARPPSNPFGIRQ